ncbi:MAG: T9SS type A sorting domain-containing protein [Bacteroidetes bacterium]|nr:T9SS type A sorting domain-containing protein [Bacteroidota bacterium]MBL0070887.1 T9SS type A sorting domain-containing protein [Bacteroidota bacterium]
MKNYYTLIVCCCSLLVISGMKGFAQEAKFTSQGTNPNTLVIDNQDSVYFDLFNSTVVGSTIEFPVFIKSDDVINALDFSFKYNENELEYDTIINLTNYIQHLSYYNPGDSTVRFTSYSFTQPYTVDTALVLVRFTVLTGVFCSNDLLNAEALLNGDGCSEIIIECQSTGIADEFNETSVSVYPNPSDKTLFIDVDKMSVLDIYDISGKNYLIDFPLEENFTNEIPTHNLADGVYFLKIKYEEKMVVKKLVIQHY